jgi:hypothetical protein
VVPRSRPVRGLADPDLSAMGIVDRVLGGGPGREHPELVGVPRSMQGLPAALVALGSIALGCAGTVPAATTPEDGLPLLVAKPTAPMAPARAEDEAEPMAPADGAVASPCPLQWTPREMRAGVFTLPAELHGRMVTPLIRALCACTRPGQSIAVVAHLVPEHGEVTAQTADRPEQHARTSRSIDACLARELGAGRYEPFRVGSDNVCAAPPPRPAARSPGQPAHLSTPKLVGCGPEEERFTTIVYPLYFDRRDER